MLLEVVLAIDKLWFPLTDFMYYQDFIIKIIIIITLNLINH